jgi:hypothetical protein
VVGGYGDQHRAGFGRVDAGVADGVGRGPSVAGGREWKLSRATADAGQ